MSQSLPYDITSPESILEYAKGLSGKTLEEVADLPDFVENIKDKGDLGKMVERYYFRHVPPNNHDPDFAEAGVELKTTGVKTLKNGEYRAKERLVLTNIDYNALDREEWLTNTLLTKCGLMLLLFYYYEKIAIYKRRFVYEPLLWSFPDTDLEIIKKDWETIKQKIREGKAHELSEGDTFYLGACRKGSGGEKEPLKTQPYSETKAKARAFSLKPSYINTIIDGHAKPALIKNTDDAHVGLEELVEQKFAPYIGKTIEEISEMFDFHKQSKNHKGFGKSLVMRILGTTKKTIPEFEKADIEMKLLTLNRSGTPTEYLQFPTFDYMKIIDEEWVDSSFYAKLEKKFLFIVFQIGEDKKVRLSKTIFWNMPYADRMQAKRVWEDTKHLVATHKAEQKYLPKISDERVAHVRPHGANNTTALFPTPQGDMLPRLGFWLNKKYIAEQIKAR